MSVTGPFGNHAGIYLAAGLRVFPTGGEDGKKPLIRYWPKVGRRYGLELIQKFPEANIGIPDGDHGGITRIDVDDPALATYAIDRFGDTPMKVGTPSDGLHLWYKASGEGRKIRLEGLRIDVLGRGGYGLAPPSINPQKGAYAFLEGHPGLIERLPKIRPGALSASVYGRPPAPARTSSPKPLQEMRDGDGRNSTLFKTARREAVESETVDGLTETLLVHNERFGEPLLYAEVERIARSVMRYKSEGRLWLPGSEAHAQIARSELYNLGDNGDAVLLLLRLRTEHGWRNGGHFPLANAFAAALAWGIPRFRKARDFLVERRFIACPHPGGKGPHDPPRYRLLR